MVYHTFRDRLASVTALVLYFAGTPVAMRVLGWTPEEREFPASVVIGASIAGTVAVFVAVAVAGCPVVLSAFATVFAALALALSFACAGRSSHRPAPRPWFRARRHRIDRPRP